MTLKDIKLNVTDEKIFKMKYKNEATITLEDISLIPRVSFLDYVFGGCEIGVNIAIDFTLSNGAPNEPQSLHYLDPISKTNEYVKAIEAVMNIVQDYDTD